MSILILILIVVTQVATGSALILLISGLKIRSIYLVIGLGLALGTFISMLSAVALTSTAISGVAWLLPTLVAGVISLVRRRAFRQSLRELKAPNSEGLAVFTGLAIGLLLIAINWTRVPLESVRAGASVDMYFFEAISRGVGQFGAGGSILMSDGSLRYHWFTYGWAGELANSAGLAPFVSLTRVLPIVALVGVVLIAAGWANSIPLGVAPSPRWVPTLAVLLIVAGGYTGALYGVVLNFDSPSQSFTTVWLLALVVIFLRGLTTSNRRTLIAASIVAGVLGFAVTGGKASHALIALGGFGVVTLGGLFLRQSWWPKAALLGVSVVLGATVAYFWVLSGVGVEQNLAEDFAVRASTWQALDPVTGRWGPLLGTLALILAILARLSGAIWLYVRRESRRSPEVLFAAGALLVGLVALLLLREGINELWFILAASAPISVISAVGVGQSLTWLNINFPDRKFWIVIGITAAFASGVSLILSYNWEFAGVPVEFFLWPGILFWLAIVAVWILIPLLSVIAVRNLSVKNQLDLGQKALAIVAISVAALTLTSLFTRPAVLWTESRKLITDFGIVTPNAAGTPPAGNAATEESLESDRFAAATWFVDNAEPEDIVATSNPASSFIPALTGQQMYLAGERYQEGLGATNERSEILKRSNISTSLAQTLDQNQIKVLCDAGVSFVWIEGTPEISGIAAPGEVKFGQVTLVDIRDRCRVN